MTFSKSQLSFEEVALKFLQVDRKDALKIFLLKKLESLAPSVRRLATCDVKCCLCPPYVVQTYVGCVVRG